MRKEEPLRLIAEGKTGEAIKWLLEFSEQNKKNKHSYFQTSREYIILLLLSNRYHRAAELFNNNQIEYKQFDLVACKITDILLTYFEEIAAEH